MAPVLEEVMKAEQIGPRKGPYAGRSRKKVKRASHRSWRAEAKRDLENAPTRKHYKGWYD
jgi:hypothetical protein